jgi:hypothetical protein
MISNASSPLLTAVDYDDIGLTNEQIERLTQRIHEKQNKKREARESALRRQVARMDDVEDEKDLVYYLQDISNFFTESVHIFDHLRTPLKNTKIISGKVQSGKTNIICGIVAYNALVMKKTSIVLVRNFIGDYKQLALKFQADASRFSPNHLPLSAATIPVLSIIDKSDSIELRDALTNEHPSVIILIANAVQLKKINQLIEKYHLVTNFDLIVDECDVLGCHKVTPAYRTQFVELKERSAQMFGITATPMDNLNLEMDLVKQNLFKLNPPSDYKGLEAITMVPIDMNTKVISKDGVIGMSFEMRMLMTDIGSGECSPTHPNILLHKGTNHKNGHRALLECVSKPYYHPDTGVDFGFHNWTAIAYNGNGITLYNPFIVENLEEYKDNDDQIIIMADANGLVRPEDFSTHPDPKKVTKYYAKIEEDGILTFDKMSISIILSYLKDNLELCYCRNIIIACGVLAGRGINFSSMDYEWHLTHQILDFSVSGSTPDLVQSIRLCGRYRDAYPLYLYTTQSDIDNLRRAMIVHDAMETGCRNGPDGIVLRNVIPNIPIEKRHKLGRRLMKHDAKFKPKYVANGSLSDVSGESNTEEDDTIIDGVKLVNLNRWLESDTLVGRMTRYLYALSSSITVEEFHAGLPYDGTVSEFKSGIDSGKSIKSRQGKIWTCRANKVILNPKIRQYIDTKQ